MFNFIAILILVKLRRIRVHYKEKMNDEWKRLPLSTVQQRERQHNLYFFSMLEEKERGREWWSPS